MMKTADELRKASVLFLKDVYKAYGSKVVLDNVDLAVRSGELCSLVGPSGCGKSTLFRLILGEERATSGEVSVGGMPVGFPNVDRGIVYQQYSLYPFLSVFDNVVLGRRLERGFLGSLGRGKEFHDEAMFYIEAVKLAEHRDKFPHELSGGMQQRVALAQALIMKPKILLMDEPFGALDPGVREHLQVFLLELWERFKMTIFFVTHDLEEAVYVGTRILVLSQHYSDGRGNGAGVKRGSKVVFDHQLPRRAGATAVKDKAEFRALIQEIRQAGFDPHHLQHVTKFNLDHPDSFHDFTDEELKKEGA